MDTRNRLQIWYDAAERYAIATTLGVRLPVYVVTEYPKSGGSWVGQMLSDYFALPFPRNQRVGLRAAVHHAHYLHSRRLKNTLCVMRDGRDIMVSFYYHMLFENDKSSPIVVHETRRALKFSDYEDVRRNLPAFIQYLFDKQATSRSPFQFTWPEFVRSWQHSGAPIARYEQLVNDGVAEFSRVLGELLGQEADRTRVAQIVEKYSFAAQAKRPAGVEQKGSFLRKGQPGDWREKFTAETAKLFNEIAGDALVEMGYENDASWVNDV